MTAMRYTLAYYSKVEMTLNYVANHGALMAAG
jgi:hypothetical protein